MSPSRSLFSLPALGLLLLLLVAPGCERRKPAVTPPPAVAQTLRTLFPDVPADSVRWERSKKGNYEAHFRRDQLPHRLRLDGDGRHRETEIEVARRALPAAVQDTLTAHYDYHRDPKLYRVRSTSIVHYADGHTEYEVQARAAGRWKKRYYDEQGILLREQKAKGG